MPCDRRDCPAPGPHVHLRKQDEHATANVLLAAYWERRAYLDRDRRKAAADANAHAGECRSTPKRPGRGGHR